MIWKCGKTTHSRSYEKIQSLAKYRGSESGMNYAEAFEV